MKLLISLVLVLAVWWVGKTIYGEYKNKEKQESEASARAKSGVGADGLAGMNPQWEPSLQTARSQGATALRAWLDRYGPYVRDPKLADIQLDYAMMLGRQDPKQAQQIYAAVKRRTPQSSPIYPKVQKLEATLGTGR